MDSIMKVFLLSVVVAALAVSSDSSPPRAIARANLNAGYVTTGDILYLRRYVYLPAITNMIQYQDVSYQGNWTTRLTAIQATEVGYTQYASAWITRGGINQNNVTIRFQSARGYGQVLKSPKDAFGHDLNPNLNSIDNEKSIKTSNQVPSSELDSIDNGSKLTSDDTSDQVSNLLTDSSDNAVKIAEERRAEKFKKNSKKVKEAAKLSGCKPGFAVFEGKCVKLNKLNAKDKAAFDGGSCPTGLFKLNGLCL
ncbi:hypothetical protein K1T71_013000 [Dendrolimus kikuchii]|uniref:Uncharacterized protein n=1 Tax=Dendrolimus kikuchii TaxID=765133 RepID=A0ACC1CIP5_9NEOP|nr:hypothetical protein K1T71_013000 [Dendrolimus kikuchii]